MLFGAQGLNKQTKIKLWTLMFHRDISKTKLIKYIRFSANLPQFGIINLDLKKWHQQMAAIQGSDMSNYLSYFEKLNLKPRKILLEIKGVPVNYIFFYPWHPLFQGVSHVLLTNLWSSFSLTQWASYSIWHCSSSISNDSAVWLSS